MVANIFSEKSVGLKITFSGGEKEELELPLLESGKKAPLSETVSSLLEDSESFLSLLNPKTKSPEIINKDQILFVKLPPEKNEDSMSINVKPVVHSVEIKLHDGSSLKGKLQYFMPPQTSRILDYIGDDQRFIQIQAKSALLLVNKRHIVKMQQARKTKKK
jgi:hypothetical protein